MSIYSDISKTGANLKDKDSVLESLRNILSTNKGERLFHREFGCNLERYLFDPLNFTTSRLIMMDITSSITRYDHRIKIKSLDVELDYDNRSYRILLQVTITGLENPIVYEDILKVKV